MNWPQCSPQSEGKIFPLILSPSSFVIWPFPSLHLTPRVDKLRVRVTDEVHCSMGGKAQTVVIQRDQVEILVIMVICITILICRQSLCRTSRSQRQGSSSRTHDAKKLMPKNNRAIHLVQNNMCLHFFGCCCHHTVHGHQHYGLHVESRGHKRH